jgi:hypothetical protein
MCSLNPECGIVDIDNVEAGDDVKKHRKFKCIFMISHNDAK